MRLHERRDPGAQAPGLAKGASDGGSPKRVPARSDKLDDCQVEALAEGRDRLRGHALMAELYVDYRDEATWPEYPQLLERAT